ncbi:PIN domain-containing protein [Dactylosporangium sp. NPDC005555]|uniref:PIN domain-containing protein n=1 Tax=Dactylosporangium sp. NPDC005555 TaxID=3154889 RepID=UPI0033A99BC1
MAWVRNTEIHYTSLFAEDEMLGLLHSTRHWHIRAHGWSEDIRIGLAVVTDELDAQRRHILEAIDTLGRLVPLRERDGEMLLLDTNTMLHYRPADEILWNEEFGFKRSRLIVPLVVLDELDQKTYASSKQLAGRAETRLRMLDKHLEKAVGGASEIRPGVTLEILADPPNHRRHSNVDHEILDRAEQIFQSVERAVTVVSGDRGMRVRGLSRGIPVMQLGVKFRLPLGDV